jgi:ribosomal protein L35
MSSQKTNKSFTKRLRVTKTGKVLGRKAGFNHFNAKQRRVKQLAGKVPQVITLTKKVVQQNLPHHSVK